MVAETTQHLSLDGQRVLLVAGTSGIGRQVARDAAAAGAHVTITSRRLEDAQQAAKQLSAAGNVTVAADTVDLSDEASMRDLAQRTGRPDHLVTLGSAPANGSIAELERDHIVRALDAKVIGPLLLVKHLPPKVSITLFSGIVAWRPQAGLTVMGTANGAVSFLAQSLAVDLAPVRANAVSPGIVDSGAWDRLGEEAKAEMFGQVASRNPARRVGQPRDVSAAVLYAMTNPFVTGTTLHVNGGGHLV